MAVVTAHALAHTFVSELRRVERELHLHIPTESELLCFNRAVFITDSLCSGSSLFSLTQRHSNSSAAPEEEFNPIITAVGQSGETVSLVYCQQYRSQSKATLSISTGGEAGKWESTEFTFCFISLPSLIYTTHAEITATNIFPLM